MAYLVLHLVDGTINGGVQLVPARTQHLHCVRGVDVVKDQGSLHRLVQCFQIIHL